mmetsp:Transcript_64582/g.203844  ORF Transcript_64582/g.203844 Transcript_64582/m.203844 type:complete len:203 (+) Transcript_64582:582-1190(+)
MSFPTSTWILSSRAMRAGFISLRPVRKQELDVRDGVSCPLLTRERFSSGSASAIRLLTSPSETKFSTIMMRGLTAISTTCTPFGSPRSPTMRLPSAALRRSIPLVSLLEGPPCAIAGGAWRMWLRESRMAMSTDTTLEPALQNSGTSSSCMNSWMPHSRSSGVKLCWRFMTKVWWLTSFLTAMVQLTKTPLCSCSAGAMFLR